MNRCSNRCGLELSRRDQRGFVVPGHHRNVDRAFDAIALSRTRRSLADDDAVRVWVVVDAGQLSLTLANKSVSQGWKPSEGCPPKRAARRWTFNRLRVTGSRDTQGWPNGTSRRRTWAANGTLGRPLSGGANTSRVVPLIKPGTFTRHDVPSSIFAFRKACA